MRMLVVGPSGAGKSTLSRRLAAKHGVPLIHLDAEYWRPGWNEPPKDEWAAQVDALVARDAWIMDGNYSGTFAARLAAADTIVFLDLDKWVCVGGVYKRWWQTRGRVRPDLGPGCPEKLPSPSFLWWIWNYETRSRPKILALLDAAGSGKKVVVLKTRAEVDRYGR